MEEVKELKLRVMALEQSQRKTEKLLKTLAQFLLSKERLFLFPSEIKVALDSYINIFEK